MLTSLTIKNYALIDKLQVNFKEGFTTITGETGAGKSILLGGLSLILGKRADTNNLREKDKNCIVEATFDIEEYKLRDFFNENDLDYDKTTIIRRVIVPSGKSRAFINDSPVNLNKLQLLGSRLIDIHSQHETLQLMSDDFQFKIIDALARTQYDLTQYQDSFKKYNTLKTDLEELSVVKATASKEHGYNSFLLKELVEAKIVREEFAALEEEYETLNNVEAIQEKLAESYNLLNDGDSGVLAALKTLKNTINKLSTIGNKYESISERVNSIYIELDDVFSEIEGLKGTVEDNPERLRELDTKLSKLNGLMYKHQVKSSAELLEVKDELEKKVESTENVDEEIAKKEEEIIKIKEELDLLAGSIHTKRKITIPELKTRLKLKLSDLGMPNAEFSIAVEQQEDKYYANGKDTLRFLFSANKGGQFSELKKSASGGELSRIMLAIKSIIAENVKLPTIMFDEIDSGVSGEISNQMGDIMKGMSRKMQVFTITHLPQVAAKGKTQYKVYKEDIDNKTRTNLVKLSHEDRIKEVAYMLSGDEPTDSALAHAIQLLN